MMRLKSEDEILNAETRKRIIEEIEGAENVHRRSQAFKWHEIWKNKSKQYVRALLHRMLDQSTVHEMEYTLSNISITKKIIDKLAKVYSNGVERKYDGPEDTKRLATLEEKLEINMHMKTSNKLLKLMKNATVYIKPVSFIDKNGERKWRPAWVPMSTHLYDVIEMENDRTKPMVYILSNFERSEVASTINDQAVPELAASHMISSSTSHGDGIDQKIADRKEDAGEGGEKKVYIWWTDSYHMTTLGIEAVNPETMNPLEGGADGVINPDLVRNPIEIKPFIDLHIDQEGHYWAEGGEDLIDGDLLINTMISNVNHIGVTQGYGQLVMIGDNLPQSVKLGPNKTINLPTGGEDGEAGQTSAEFITADPPLDGLSRLIEMYTALLLTTNNLSTTGVQARLSGGIEASSGVALALDKAESLEDVKDQRDIFLKAEKTGFKITAEWIQFFDQEGELDEDFAECKIPIDEAPKTEFGDAMIIQSDKEKLENLSLRKTLGINRAVELIMKDRGLTEPDAEKILAEIIKEQAENLIALRGDNPVDNPDDDPNNNDGG